MLTKVIFTTNEQEILHEAEFKILGSLEKKSGKTQGNNKK